MNRPEHPPASELGDDGTTVRPDIDPVAISNGAVVIVLSILMSVLQFGREGVAVHGADVLAVFAAALDPVVPAPAPPT